MKIQFGRLVLWHWVAMPRSEPSDREDAHLERAHRHVELVQPGGRNARFNGHALPAGKGAALHVREAVAPHIIVDVRDVVRSGHRCERGGQQRHVEGGVLVGSVWAPSAGGVIKLFALWGWLWCGGGGVGWHALAARARSAELRGSRSPLVRARPVTWGHRRRAQKCSHSSRRARRLRQVDGRWQRRQRRCSRPSKTCRQRP
jgi:hypothetical protein